MKENLTKKTGVAPGIMIRINHHDGFEGGRGEPVSAEETLNLEELESGAILRAFFGVRIGWCALLHPGDGR
jgi:hypothetical protein